MNNILAKPIQTPNGFYFYDANTNQIIKVSVEEFIELSEALNNEDECNVVLSKYQRLGLFVPSEIKEIEYPELSRIEYYLDRHINQIILQVTQNCNLRCKYCSYSNSNNTTQRNHSLKHMDFDTAKKGIDYFVKHSSDSEDVAIGLYGGEPLIEFDLVKKIIEYSNQQFRGKNITFSLTTNGTLLTPDKFKYLIDNNVSIVLSIDGPKQIHDKNRIMVSGKGSFDLIMRNLKSIYDKWGERLYSRMSMNMVVDPMNDLDEICSLFENFLFKNLHLRFTIVDDVYTDLETRYSNEFVRKFRYQYFVLLLQNKNIIDGIECEKLFEQRVSQFEDEYESYQKKYEKIPEKWAPSGPCIPGKRRLFIDVNGNFFPCERVSETSEIMNIGSLDEGFKLDKIKELVNIGHLTQEECKRCYAINKCTICARLVDDNGILSPEKKLTHCASVKQEMERNLREVLLVKELKNYM